MTSYRYQECGLDNVIINGVTFVTDDKGDSVTRIPNINGLHRAIALGIVKRQAMMSGKEMRFLRTELGMTQAELAAMIHREPLTVSRWERGEHDIDANAETLIRLEAIGRLQLNVTEGVNQISGWSIPSAIQSPIVINGADTGSYLLAA